MTFLARLEQDYLKKRYPQPTCLCGKKMIVGMLHSDEKIYHICAVCGKLRHLGGRMAEFIARTIMDDENNSPAFTLWEPLD
jgi:hypothetical protein